MQKNVSLRTDLSYHEGMDMEFAPAPLSVSATVLSQMFLYLASQGVDIDGFLRSLGIDPPAVRSPDAQIPVETYLFIQEEAARYLEDPYFGLHMGEYAEPGSWSILGYLMMNCSTLGKAFEKANRYSRIIGNMIEAVGQWQFNRIKVVFFTPRHVPDMSRHCFEAALSSSVRLMRTLTGTPASPRNEAWPDYDVGENNPENHKHSEGKSADVQGRAKEDSHAQSIRPADNLSELTSRRTQRASFSIQQS